MTRTAIAACIAAFACVRVFAAPPVEAYGKLPGVELIRLSPSGDRYALIALAGEQRRLIVRKVKGELIFISNIGDKKIRRLAWADDEHLLVQFSNTFSSPLEFRNTYELSGVLVIRPSVSKGFAVFAKQEGIGDAVFGVYGVAKVDGQLLGYFGGITYEQSRGGGYHWEDGYPDLYAVNLDTGKAKMIAKAQDRRYSWVMDRDGTVAAHSEYDGKSGRWRLFQGRTRDKLLLEKTTPLDEIDLWGLGHTPGTVLITDDSGERDVISEISLSDASQQELLAEESVERLLADPETGQLIGCTMQERPYAKLFDLALQSRFNGTRKAFPANEMTLQSWSRNFDRLIVKTDGGEDSGTYWLVDIATGKADELGWQYPQVKPKDVGPTKLIQYIAADGLAMDGVLTLPRGREPKNLPLVMMPHGGPIGISDTIGFDWWAQAYTSLGYAVFQPNYRGSGGHGVAFRKAGFGEWGRKMQSDLSDGLAALTKQGIVDAKRVCIVGGSYGGYAALAGVTLQQGLYRCAVSVAGVSDLQNFFFWQSQRYGFRSNATRYWKAVTGAEKDASVLRTISPTASAQRADAPVLLIHGKDDTVVPFEQSERMASALRDARRPVELITMQSEDHWLSREQTRVDMLKAAVAFVRQHNPPD